MSTERECVRCGEMYVPHSSKLKEQKFCSDICKRRNCRNARVAVIALLGGKCVRCGFTDLRALQIDHVDGNGSDRRRNGETWWKMCKAILAGTYDAPVQILCANCNWIKRAENHEHTKTGSTRCK